MIRFPWSMLLFSVIMGCKNKELDNIIVQKATLDLDMPTHGMLAVVGGYASGPATLTVEDEDGVNWSIPVQLGGSLWGAGGSMGFDVLVDESLSIPDKKTLSVADVLGGYSGGELSVMAGIGFSSINLKNPAGCQINIVAMDVGAGVEMAGALMTLRATDDPENLDGPPESVD